MLDSQVYFNIFILNAREFHYHLIITPTCGSSPHDCGHKIETTRLSIGCLEHYTSLSLKQNNCQHDDISVNKASSMET